jgi:predicted RNA-binding protein with RPS1 domain
LAVLVSCTAVNVDNKVLCEALLHSVAPNFEFTYAGQENADRVREDVSSKLLLCKQGMSRDVTTPAVTANPQEVAAYFKENVIPLLDDNMKRHIILALKHIIANDAPIVAGNKRKRIAGIADDVKVDYVSGTTKAALAVQTKFCYHAFLAGVFLFVTTQTGNRVDANVIGAISNGDVSLYSIRTVKDKTGRERKKTEVGNRFALSFTSRIDEIKLIEEEEMKKAALIEAAKQGVADVEFAEDFTGQIAEKLNKLVKQTSNDDRDLLITLLTEARGKCLHCGKELGIPVRRKKATSNCAIVYAKLSADEAESYENAVAVCATPCAAEVKLMEDDEKRTLLEDKRRCADVQAFLGRISNVIKNRREIEAVLRKIHDMKNDTKLPKSKLSELKEIKQKLNEPYLVDEVNASMVRMYKTVKSICGRLDDEGALDSSIFGDMMKAAQGTLSGEVMQNPNITDPQGYVTQLLVEKLHAQVGQKYLDACKVIVGFLIKRCDLFNETAKQS